MKYGFFPQPLFVALLLFFGAVFLWVGAELSVPVLQALGAFYIVLPLIGVVVAIRRRKANRRAFRELQEALSDPTGEKDAAFLGEMLSPETIDNLRRALARR